MSNYVLDKPYKTMESIGAYRAVIFGEEDGTITLPAWGNDVEFAGVTVHSQSIEGAMVSVRKCGIARVIACREIVAGDPVAIAGSPGSVAAYHDMGSAVKPGEPVNCIGIAETHAFPGDPVEVFLCIHQRMQPIKSAI